MPQQDLATVERLKTEASNAAGSGDLALAVQLLSQAISIAQTPKVQEAKGAKHFLSILYSNRAAIRALQHDYIEALVDAKESIRQDATWPKPYLRKATAYLGLNQPHAALQILDRGVAACSSTSINEVNGCDQFKASTSDVWQLLSVRADVEVAATMQQRAAKRLRPLPSLLRAPSNAHMSAAALDQLSAAPAPASASEPPAPANGSVPGGPDLIRHCLDLLDAAAVARGATPGPQPDDERVGVTVISGFLGAGKTTLLTRIVQEGPDQVLGLDKAVNKEPCPGAHRPLRFGVVVNDMASINIDGMLAQDAAAAGESGGPEKEASAVKNVVEMSNGCICCGLKGDMLLEVSQLLCKNPSINYLVIESTGVGQPMPIAAAFASQDERKRSLLDYIRIDCLVTVVDTPRFHQDMKATHTPGEAPKGAALAYPAVSAHAVMDDEDCRPLAELLAEQIEFANVVLLNKEDGCEPLNGTIPVAAPVPPAKPDAVPSPLVQRVTDIIQGLNPHAHVVPTRYCQCPLSEVINTNRFDFGVMTLSSRWQQEMLRAPDASEALDDHAHEEEMYGIHSTVYESRRPFHPGRLRDWLHNGLAACLPQTSAALPTTTNTSSTVEGIQPVLPPQLLRSKGFFWLASCPQVAWEWSTAGAAARLVPYGEWLAGKLPRRCWPEDGRRAGWDQDWGDRINSLVFIVQGKADFDAIRKGLDNCLLTPEEEDQHITAANNNHNANGNGNGKAHEPSTSGSTHNATGAAGSSADDDEDGITEDGIWYAREQAWAQLPGATAWEQLLESS